VIKPGLKLNNYQILELIGKGASGSVFKAYDHNLQRNVAIKALHYEAINNKQHIQKIHKRFKKEAQMASKCTHPNILTIFEYIDSEKAPCIVMEYIQGDELRSLMQDRFVLKVTDIISIMSQVLLGLGYAHSLNVIHRDLKPGNILLLPEKKVKIMDFGIAKITGDYTLTGDSTKPGRIIGTPNYMSPEQLVGKDINQRSDLYAIGLVLFELLSRTKKLRATPPRGHQLRSLPKITTSVLKQFIPTEFIPVIIKALAPDQANRYQTAESFRTSLFEQYKMYLNNNASPQVKKKINTALNHNQKNVQAPPAEDIHFTWNDEILKVIEREFSEINGPIGSVMVRRYSKQYNSYADLIHVLSEKIENDQDKAQFLKKTSGNLNLKSKPMPTPNNVTTMGTANLTNTAYTQTSNTMPQRRTASHNNGQAVNGSRTTMPSNNMMPENEWSQSGTAEIFTQDALSTVNRQLTEYLGPIAGRLVQKEAFASASHGELYRRLSEYIPNETEKRQFMRNVPVHR